jgi:uncharacterized repeat protein (TIGR01451 family)
VRSVDGCTYRANAQPQPENEFHGCDEASVVVPPNPYVDLGVVKTVSAATVAPGATLTWTLVATNHGPGTSTGFVLADELPAGVTFVSAAADPALTCSTPPAGAAGSIVCTAPSVPAAPAAGSTLTVTITATVPPDSANGAVLPNVTTVNGDQPEPVPDPHPNRDITLTRVVVDDQPLPPPPPPPPDPDGPLEPPAPTPEGGVLPEQVASTRLTLRKRATGRQVSPGATVTFRLRVRNGGDAAALRVRICDRLPRGLRAISAPGFSASGRTLCRRIGRIGVGAERVLHVTVRVRSHAPRVMGNVATARASNAPRVLARAAIGTPNPRFTG